MWTLEKFGEVFWMAQNLKEKIMDYDPMMKRSIKFTPMITEALQPLQEMFNELKRQKQQLPITMFFHKVEKAVSTIEDPQPSTSFAPDVILQSSFSSDQPSPSYEEDGGDTLFPFRQKVNSQAQRHNAYTMTPLHLLIVGIVLSSYHRRHRHHQ